MRISSLVFRKKKEGLSTFYASAIFQVSQTKNNISKWHILGWHILNSFSIILQFFCIIVSITKAGTCYMHFLVTLFCI